MTRVCFHFFFCISVFSYFCFVSTFLCDLIWFCVILFGYDRNDARIVDAIKLKNCTNNNVAGFLYSQTASLNPFENNNGKFFDVTGGYDGSEKLNNNNGDSSAPDGSKERDNYSPSLSDDPKHDLVDLRRQVVYLQVFSTRSPFYVVYCFISIHSIFIHNFCALRFLSTWSF